MRTLIISAVLVVSPACSLFFESQDRSQVTQVPDAGVVNDACHGSGGPIDAGGCCGQTPDGGGWNWPDAGIEDGGGYLPDAGWDPSPDGGVLLPDGGY